MSFVVAGENYFEQSHLEQAEDVMKVYEISTMRSKINFPQEFQIHENLIFWWWFDQKWASRKRSYFS